MINLSPRKSCAQPLGPRATRRFQARLWPSAIVVAAISFAATRAVWAIDILPRDYFPLPAGTSVTALYYDFATANQFNLANGPTLTNATHYQVNVGVFRQIYYGAIDGRSWAAQLVLPFGMIDSEIAGQKLPQGRGVGDIAGSLAVSLLPTPEPDRNIAISLYVSAPTGSYQANRTLNLGTRRWTFDAQAGYTQGISENFWFDVAVDVIGYTDNRATGTSNATLHQGPSFQGQVWLSYLPSAASLISIGYSAMQGGHRSIDSFDTGLRTQSQQVRGAYTQFFTPWSQLVVSVGHDVAVTGGFKREVELLIRAAVLY